MVEGKTSGGGVRANGGPGWARSMTPRRHQNDLQGRPALRRTYRTTQRLFPPDAWSRRACAGTAELTAVCIRAQGEACVGVELRAGREEGEGDALATLPEMESDGGREGGGEWSGFCPRVEQTKSGKRADSREQ